jgi:integrase
MTIKGIYFTCNRKPGKPVRHYVYAWRGGPLIATKVGGERPRLGAAEMEAYHRAVKESRSPRPDTMGGLIADYRKSIEWKRLADSTRKNWTIIVDRIEAKWRDSSLAVWSDPRMVTKVMAWRNESANQPRKADNQITVLRHLLEWARLNGRVLVNVATGIPQLYDGGDRAEIIWTPEDLAAFAKVAPQHVNDGVRLACLTGLRRADLVALTWAEVGDKAIVRLALKSARRKRRKAGIPMIAELRALLVNSFGRPWTGDGFGNSVIRLVAKAGLRHDDGRPKHLHDCRGTYATKLILAGLTDEEAAGVLAWAPERVGNIRKVYVDQARVIVALADRIDAASVNRTVNRHRGTSKK